MRDLKKNLLFTMLDNKVTGTDTTTTYRNVSKE